MLVIAELQIPFNQKVHDLRFHLPNLFFNFLLFLFNKFDLEFGQLTFVSIVNDFIPCLIIKNDFFDFSLDASDPLVISPEADLESRHHIEISKEQMQMFFCPSRCCVILKNSLSIQYSPQFPVIPKKAYFASVKIIRWCEFVNKGFPHSLKTSHNEPFENLFFVSLVYKFNVSGNSQENGQAFDMRNQGFCLPNFLAVVGLLIHHVFPF